MYLPVEEAANNDERFVDVDSTKRLVRTPLNRIQRIVPQVNILAVEKCGTNGNDLIHL